MILMLQKLALIALIIVSSIVGDAIHTNTNRKNQEKYIFALIPKSTVNPFFIVAMEGCLDKAEELGNVECLYRGPKTEDQEEQNAIVRSLLKNGAVQGIAISVINSDVATEVINEAIDAGVPVITFDSDAPQSRRITYVGTDNLGLGEHLAKVLLLLDPEGGSSGKYGFVSGAGPNLAQREQGFNKQMRSLDAFKSEWTEIGSSPTDSQGVEAIALEQCYDYANDPDVRAIVPVGGWPMWNATPWKTFVDTCKDNNKTISLVVADTLQVQIELINQGYCDGLVGQLPYEMGTISMETLYAIMQGQSTSKEIRGTNVLQVLSVPINLPPVDVNNNYIGALRYVGIACYVIIALTSITFIVVAIVFRKTRVMRSSHISFILSICVGTLICGSFLITTAIDDQYYSQKACDIACKVTPWVLTMGFTVFFSGLFAKTYSIYIHVTYGEGEIIKVSKKKILLPLLVVLAANFIVLMSYTIISPLYFERSPDDGSDPWNRVLATSGRCRSPNANSPVFASVLYSIALLYVLVAVGMSYHNRGVSTEYSESFFITLSIAGTLEALIIGAPVLILTKNSPKTLYIVGMILATIVNMMVLLLNIIPKILYINSKPVIVGSSIGHKRNPSSVASDYQRNSGTGLSVTKEKITQLKFLSDNTNSNDAIDETKNEFQ